MSGKANDNSSNLVGYTGEQGKDFRKEEEAARQNNFSQCGQEQIMPWCFFITVAIPKRSGPWELICAAGYTDYF